MKIRSFLIVIILGTLLGTANSFGQKKSKKDELVTLETSMGTMHLILFDETPKHKANFLKLVEQKFYDGLLFHRVIEDFMIQGGDPESKNADTERYLGNGGNGYRIPAELDAKRFHQKGALAAARDNNPNKESSGCQFYLVQGHKWSTTDLAIQESRAARKLTEEQKNTYQTIGGTPHLDGAYSVFGQVIDGISVIDKIAEQPRDSRNRPEKNIVMHISAKKMSKKKIARKYKF